MTRIFPLAALLLAGCGHAPVDETPLPEPEPFVMPVDLSGSWERDYARDDDVNANLRRAYNLLTRTMQDQYRLDGQNRTGMTPRQAEALLALARLGELITRPDVLTISQTKHEISIDRKDDFAMQCRFYDDGARSTLSPYGRETCAFRDRDLLSELLLPEGLRIVSQFTISEDGERLRVVTTLSSPTSRVPFTLRRFYRKFERLPPEYNCVETLSMKRVCSTGELEF